MRNNKLIMTFGEDEETFSHLPRGLKESLRVKSLERAKEVMAKRDNGTLSSAVYKDRFGVETNIRKYVKPDKTKK